MGTEIRVWEIVNSDLVQVSDNTFANSHIEAELEAWIEKSPEILGEQLLVIGKQLIVPGGRLDLLGMDSRGQIVIIELKRDRAPREALAQALDYASWLASTAEDELNARTEDYLGRTINEAFEEYFGVPAPAWTCQNHRIVLVAARLDFATERIINYLATRQLEINAAFFNYSKLSEGKEILIRSFLVPEEIASKGRESTKELSLPELIEKSEDPITRNRVQLLIDQWRHLGYAVRPGTSGASFLANIGGVDRPVFWLWTGDSIRCLLKTPRDKVSPFASEEERQRFQTKIVSLRMFDPVAEKNTSVKLSSLSEEELTTFVDVCNRLIQSSRARVDLSEKKVLGAN